MKSDGIHFTTLKEATDMILQLDFDRVLEYKMTFKTSDAETYWVVKRKILGNFPLGEGVWVAL